MPPIEDLLRDELQRVAETVQPEQPRLEVLVRRRGSAASSSIAAVAASPPSACGPARVAGPSPARPSGAGPDPALPRYYLMFDLRRDGRSTVCGYEAVIREISATQMDNRDSYIVTDYFPVRDRRCRPGRPFLRHRHLRALFEGDPGHALRGIPLLRLPARRTASQDT